MKRDELSIEDPASAESPAPRRRHRGWPARAATLWWTSGAHWGAQPESARQAELESLRAQLRPADLRSERAAAALAYLAAVARHAGWPVTDDHGLAAYTMLQGGFVEMAEGDGRTLALALAAAAAALAGLRVHLVTASDDDALRDQQALQPLFDRLGLRSAAVLPGATRAERVEAYRREIVLVSASALMADHRQDEVFAAAGTPQRDGDAAPDIEAAQTAPLLPAREQVFLHAADRLLLDDAMTPVKAAPSAGGDAGDGTPGPAPVQRLSVRTVIARYARLGGAGTGLYDARRELRRVYGAAVLRLAPPRPAPLPIACSVYVDADARDAAAAWLASRWKRNARAVWTVTEPIVDVRRQLIARGTDRLLVILTCCHRARRFDQRWLEAMSDASSAAQADHRVVAMLSLDDPLMAELIPRRWRTWLHRLADVQGCLPSVLGVLLRMWTQGRHERLDALRREAVHRAVEGETATGPGRRRFFFTR